VIGHGQVRTTHARWTRRSSASQAGVWPGFPASRHRLDGAPAPPKEPAVRDHPIGPDLTLCGVERLFEAELFPLTPQHRGAYSGYRALSLKAFLKNCLVCDHCGEDGRATATMRLLTDGVNGTRRAENSDFPGITLVHLLGRTAWVAVPCVIAVTKQSDYSRVIRRSIR
jgi:hypothetical protein